MEENNKILRCKDGILAGIGDEVQICYRKYEGAFGWKDYYSSGLIKNIDDDYVYIINANASNKHDVISRTSIAEISILSSPELLTPIPDNVNHPSHYKSETGLEAIDAIEAFTFDLKGIEAVDTGNVLKYICRWKKKNGLEDLKKAQWYLNHLIKHVENLEKENEL